MSSFLNSKIALTIAPLLLVGMGVADQNPAMAQSVGTKQTTTSICPAQLAGAINPILNRAQVARVRWGVLIQNQGESTTSAKTLFSRNPDQLFVPASNNKLLTTAAALKQLGAQYRIRTIVQGDSTQPNLATLRIIGRGDPSLTTTQLTTLAQQLNQRGIRQVTQLVGDDTYFRGAALNPNWDPEDTLTAYGAAVNGLMLNQNAIGLTLFPQRVGQPLRVQWDDPTDAADWVVDNQSLTVSSQEGEFVDATRNSTQWRVRVTGQLRAGSASEFVGVSVPNPGNYLVGRFRSVLTAANIAVTRSTLVKQTPAPLGEVELAAVESPPLSQLLIETNQESNNVYAEALLKTLGRVQTPTNSEATQGGVAAVKAVLAPLGVNSSGYTMTDGSGLAANNRLTPNVLVQVLQAMAQLPEATVYRNSLPVAGVNGTLKNRFRNTPAQGIVLAKTGTISGVVSLSGYITPPSYSPVVFSILTNFSNESTNNVRRAVDDIVLVLTRLRTC